MALGKRAPLKAPLGIWAMGLALVLAAFLGAAAGLIWQSLDWFDEPEEEVLTNEGAAS